MLAQVRVGRVSARRRDPDRGQRFGWRSTQVGASRRSTCSRRASSLLLVTDFAYGLLTLHGGYTTISCGSTPAGSAPTCSGARPVCIRRWRASTSRRAVARSALTPLPARAVDVRVARWRRVIGIIHDLRTGDLDYLAIRRRLDHALRARRRRGWRGSCASRNARSSASACSARAGAELVAATDRDEIDRVAVDGRERTRRRPAPRSRCAARDEAGSLHSRRRLGGHGRAPVRRHDRLAGVLAAARRRGRDALGSSAEEARAVGLPATHDRGRSPSPLAPRRAEPSDAARRRPRRVVQGGARRPARSRHARSHSRSTAPMLSEEVHRRRGEARFASLVRHASDLITVLRARHHGHLSEPVDRAHPRLRRRTIFSGSASTALRSPATATGSRRCVADDRGRRARPVARVRPDPSRRQRPAISRSCSPT